MRTPLYPITVPRRRWFGFLCAFLPSFVADLAKPREDRPVRVVHPTSYLDGLRGLAAVAVFLYHFTDYNHKYFLPAWGAEGSSPLQLPYVRVIYSGIPMVHIFFVISGFALSYRPLKELHSRNVELCHALVASSIFRRPIRLFVPCLVLTFINAILCQLGFLHNYLKPKPTLWAQIADWASDGFRAITWPWAWDSLDRPRYNVHLWTIPVEFVHSMLLFLFLLLLSKLRMSMRSLATAAFMLYSLYCGKSAAFEFLGGTFLADLHLLQARHVPKRSSRVTKILLGILQAAVLLAAGWIISWPPNPSDITPSYAALRSMAPSLFQEKKNQEAFWFSVSAFAVVWTSGSVPLIRKALESQVSQYIGRISFAFYILQHPVLNLVMYQLHGSPAVFKEDGQLLSAGSGLKGWIGVDTASQKMLCWFLGLVVIGSLLVWAADLFTRAVDTPCVKAARRLEAIVCIDEDVKA